MTSDICNAPLSLKTSTALESWNNMVRAFLAHGTTTPQHLGAVLEAEPDFAMGFAAKGLFSLMMGGVSLLVLRVCVGSVWCWFFIPRIIRRVVRCRLVRSAISGVILRVRL